MFREIPVADFDRRLADAALKRALADALTNCQAYVAGLDRRSLDAALQEGPLHIPSSLRAPAFLTLVLGDLVVDGVLDLRGAYDRGGVLVVTGDVRCGHLLGDIDALVLIGGDLDVEGAVVTGFEDSALYVAGALRARLFIGNDIGAEVGAGARVDYGIGYWSALGSRGGPFHNPRHGEEATIEALRPEPRGEGYPFDADDIAAWIRAGKPLFR